MNKTRILEEVIEYDLGKVYKSCKFTEEFIEKLMTEYGYDIGEACTINKYITKNMGEEGLFSEVHSVAYAKIGLRNCINMIER